MPRAAIRRPLTITSWLLMSTVCLLLSPLLAGAAWLWSTATGRPQALIFTRLAIRYFALELITLIACGALWLASGAGLLMGTKPLQRIHFRLLRWFVHWFARQWCALLAIELAPGGPEQAARALQSERPLLLFSRHAGPGDTIVLLDQLLTRFHRQPSVVFKQTIVVDPCVDLIGHRLPHAILNPADPDGCEQRIEEVSRGLRERGVLLLFPEGGNFTPDRRRLAIGKLRRKGMRREADKADAMEHVLPPRPSGALAALRGNPGADVIFAAHTGLGLAAFPRELWRVVPIGRTLKTRMWLWQAADRPTDPAEQAKWIYECWREIDEWVRTQGDEA
jgi:1-acyl-sn-glycerol-3-phosphate acyltransferase